MINVPHYIWTLFSLWLIIDIICTAATAIVYWKTTRKHDNKAYQLKRSPMDES